MNADQAVARLAEVTRRKHLALNTEQSYCGWLRRYCRHVATLLPTCQANKSWNAFSRASGYNEYQRQHTESSL